MKKDKFIQQLNYSFGEGGLTCSFNDYQLSEYTQQKRRKAGKLPSGKAVKQVGIQEDGSWVLGPNLYIDQNGEMLDQNTSSSVWISHLYTGPGIAPQDTRCKINLPLSTQPLNSLILLLKQIMGHNFIPSLMLMGSCAMALHYGTILKNFLFCPIPLAFGQSGTGKTTALRAGLTIVGAYPERFYSKASLAKYCELSSNSTLPYGIDDPKSRTALGDLTVALFNGAKEGTISKGEKAPSCMAVISANFTTSEQTKY